MTAPPGFEIYHSVVSTASYLDKVGAIANSGPAGATDIDVDPTQYLEGTRANQKAATLGAVVGAADLIRKFALEAGQPIKGYAFDIYKNTKTGELSVNGYQYRPVYNERSGALTTQTVPLFKEDILRLLNAPVQQNK